MQPPERENPCLGAVRRRLGDGQPFGERRASRERLRGAEAPAGLDAPAVLPSFPHHHDHGRQHRVDHVLCTDIRARTKENAELSAYIARVLLTGAVVLVNAVLN